MRLNLKAEAHVVKLVLYLRSSEIRLKPDV
jgi:hypothetical protein